jgi:NADPH-dependent 2,4-dienoyl-CoA reductase/sulfur reductase-like enzyme/rhodanese-related sulfurtransferase
MSARAKRILIVGGVAGGASCAARARRLCERCEIVVFDRGPYVSFANCGLPYHVGDVIVEESKLLVATPKLFRERFNIDIRTEHDVLDIDTAARTITVRRLADDVVATEPYDSLVLATGARAIRPPLPGIELPGIHMVRTIPDTRRVREAVEHAHRAVVVGGGFIGLEMAENLTRRGLAVTVVEAADHVLPPVDAEIAAYVAERLETNGVSLVLGRGVAGFEPREEGGLRVRTADGASIDTDLVILAIGVRPETELARKAGLTIGDTGGILVDVHMRTSDENIWAVGDAIETTDIVTGRKTTLALAGPANRQGRLAADAIVRPDTTGARGFRGVQGTAVCGIFDLTVAMTGASEKALARANVRDYECAYLHPGSHVSYYPGAQAIHTKIVFSRQDGRILGAQAVGEADVARRIDVIAMAMQMHATVYDLEEAELCYAPQYGAAKDPVNLAGMIAANNLRGDLPLADWQALETTDAQIVDVRSPAEFARGHLAMARNIPLEELRRRMDELDRDREVWLICGVGQRAYYGTRALAQNGFTVKDLSGGMETWKVIERSRR